MKVHATGLFALMSMLFVMYLANAKSLDIEPSRSHKKATRLNSLQDKLSYNRQTGQIDFPDELEFDFFINGENTIRSRSKKVSKVEPISSFDSDRREHKQSRKNQQYYVDSKGSYQVSATVRSDGSLDTELKAVYRNRKGEKCFFARGESNCWRIDGDGKYGSISLEDDIKRMARTNTTKSRKKRELVYTDFTPTRVLKLVYVVDRAFIEWFRSLNPGDDTAAIFDAEDYIYMLNTEVNFKFRGLKEVSEGCTQLTPIDITVYAQGFYYPNIGKDWEWLQPWRSGNTIQIFTNSDDGALPSFGRWVGAGSVDGTGPFDLAVFITPRILNDRGYSVTGLTTLNSVCTPGYGDFRVSICQDRSLDVAVTLPHELGYALGAGGDGNGGCPINTYIMSPSPFAVTARTKDTWNQSSACSVAEIANHVNQYPGCLLDETFLEEDFYDQLCLGKRAENQFDINYQCKSAYKHTNSVVCSPSETVTSGKVPANACWANKKIQCTNGSDDCSFRLAKVYDGTPCIGSSPSDHVCYRGDCLEKVDVCAGRPTATPPSCSCAVLRGSLRTTCCRAHQNTDASCCYGCELNAANTECIADWTVTN